MNPLCLTCRWRCKRVVWWCTLGYAAPFAPFAPRVLGVFKKSSNLSLARPWGSRLRKHCKHLLSSPLTQPTQQPRDKTESAVLSHPSASIHAASEHLHMSSLRRAEEDGSEQEGSEPDYLGEGACCAHATPSDPGPRWYSAYSVFPRYDMSASEEWNRTRRQRWASSCGVDLSEPEYDPESEMDSEEEAEEAAAEAAEAAEGWVRRRAQLVIARAGALEGDKAHSEADALLRKYNKLCATALAPREPPAGANSGQPKASSAEELSANPCCGAGTGCSGEYVPAAKTDGAIMQVTIVSLRVSAG